MSANNRLNWNEAEKILNEYLNDFKEMEFTANFPVCDIVDYFNDIFGQWVDIDSNNSWSCHDIWFTWRNNNNKKFTVMICTYHGDITLQEIDKEVTNC